MEHNTLITNDASVLGLLVIILAFIFYTSSSKNPFWTKFYTYIPALLLCYFLPSILKAAPRPMGVQLFTLFMTLDQDVKGNMQKIADLGYKDIESAFSRIGGFYGMSAMEFSDCTGPELWAFMKCWEM